MKVQELRVGNYFDLYGNVAQMIPYDFEKWFGDKWENNAFKPIPLTEEWLLKFGFELCDICNKFKGLEMPYYANNAVLLFFNSNRTKGELLDYYIGYGSMRGGKYHVVAFRWIKYVHQLQNLYFALTSEELTTK